MASGNELDAEINDPRRIPLLRDLTEAFGTDTIEAPTIWACLWLSDIDCLEDLVRLVQPAPRAHLGSFRDTEQNVKVVQMWLQRTRSSSSTPPPTTPSTPASTPQQPSTPRPSAPGGQPPAQGSASGVRRRRRSKLMRDLCRERDQNRCVLTNAGKPTDVAHIYPFSMGEEKQDPRNQKPSFWNTLRQFWSKERVDAWYNAIFASVSGTETIRNLMSLCPAAHAYWGKAYFALKPLPPSDDKKRQDVQFFWLRPRDHTSQANILEVPSLPGDLSIGPDLTGLTDYGADQKIRSGQVISLTTDDPTRHPLPDFRLLEMQWFLHRVAAMSGAAEPRDDFEGDSDDGDDDLPRWNTREMDDASDLCLEEVPDLYMGDHSSSTAISSSPSMPGRSQEIVIPLLHEDGKASHEGDPGIVMDVESH